MRFIILLIGMILLTGCTQNTGFWGPVLEVSPPNSVMGRYDITLSTGRKLITSETNSEIQIDVIAMTNDQYCKQKWFEYDLSSYFDPSGNELRDGAPVWRATLTADENSETLSAENPIWSIWEATDATHLIIIANEVEGGGVDEESRRMVIPLDRSRWLENGIDLKLMGSGLVLRTRRLPPWPGQPKSQFKHY